MVVCILSFTPTRDDNSEKYLFFHRYMVFGKISLDPKTSNFKEYILIPKHETDIKPAGTSALPTDP